MTLRLNVEKMLRQVNQLNDFQTAGRLLSVSGTIKTSLAAPIGEVCEIHCPSGHRVLAEVVAVDADCSTLMTYQPSDGLSPGIEVIALGKSVQIPVGENMVGRTINGLGMPIDGLGPLQRVRWTSNGKLAPAAMSRKRVTERLVTGQRVIDGLLTMGRGQRMGLFAGSGVGKSTLMGEIAKHVEADVNVIALVGERGREVLPFIEDCLGSQGRAKSVVIVATSDEMAMMKLQAVRTAITIAEDFRDRGANVMFFLDSVTRLANAQKEVGLTRGELPGSRGYPSSVQSVVAALLERLGNSHLGSMTSLITVLVDGDDMDEPVADMARSILDGHIVLSRKLAASGHFPAVDVLNSLSRLFRDVTSSEHHAASQLLRKTLATYEAFSDLIRVGLYSRGTSAELDRAVDLKQAIDSFLTQSINESASIEQTIEALTHAMEGL